MLTAQFNVNVSDFYRVVEMSGSFFSIMIKTIHRRQAVARQIACLFYKCWVASFPQDADAVRR